MGVLNEVFRAYGLLCAQHPWQVIFKYYINYFQHSNIIMKIQDFGVSKDFRGCIETLGSSYFNSRFL